MSYSASSIEYGNRLTLKGVCYINNFIQKEKMNIINNIVRYRRLVAICVATCTMCISVLYAQDVSERKEIAVFKINYAGAPRDPIPQSETTVQFGNIFRFNYRVSAETTVYFDQTIVNLDAQIQSVLVELGRFDVLGSTHRLDHQNVTTFIEVLQDYREERIELPEQVLLGREPFSQQDFDSLVNSFIVVVPSLTSYELFETVRMGSKYGSPH